MKPPTNRAPSPKDALSELELLSLKCVAEGMATIIFDETLLDRLSARGLVERSEEDWVLTPAGEAICPG